MSCGCGCGWSCVLWASAASVSSSLTTGAASIAFWSLAAFCAASLSAHASRRRCSMRASAEGAGPAVKAVVMVRSQPDPAGAGALAGAGGSSSRSGVDAATIADSLTAGDVVGTAAGASTGSLGAPVVPSSGAEAVSAGALLQPQPNQLAREADWFGSGLGVAGEFSDVDVS